MYSTLVTNTTHRKLAAKVYSEINEICDKMKLKKKHAHQVIIVEICTPSENIHVSHSVNKDRAWTLRYEDKRMAK